MTADRAERGARAALSRAVGPEQARVLASVRERGAVAVWAERQVRHPDVDPEGELDLTERVGARMLCPGDAEWPTALAALCGLESTRLAASGPDACPGEPLALWVRGRGDLAKLVASAVSVVGSRAASDYGMHAAGEIGFGLAERGWTVVSGAAFGIDAAAHRGALAACGATVAVLACGVDVPYPRANTRLLEQIVEAGAVISESPPGSPPYRRRFLTRNRLVAGLSRGTVLVEAGHRSGALNTARYARDIGRAVMAVPGPVTSAMSAGCHRLLRDYREHTALVTSAADICEEIGSVGELASLPAMPAGPRDGLPELVNRLLDAMPARSAVGAAVLARQLGQPPQAVLAMLGPLAVEGLVEATAEGYRLTALGRAPSNAGTSPEPVLGAD
jgi:DNA processing protein